MSLVALGANYKTVPLEELERVSVAKAEIGEALTWLVGREGVNGAVVLSTCNRVEVYVDARTDRDGTAACRAFFEARGGGSVPGYYPERGEDVPRHLFRVVCSLDSQVLGEAQILGQAKTALAMATEAGTCTEVLTRLFKDAITVGKRVRTETAIGQDSVSLSTTAFKAAADEFDDIAACQVMFVGAGEMAELTLSYLQEAGVSDYLVTSRTLEHARAFAEACDGRAVPFEQRYDALAKADVVFTMTSASEPVIEASALDVARRAVGTAGRKLVIVDEAVPRDAQVECAELDGVVLHNLETLARVIDEGMAARMAAVGAVERMAAEAEDAFLAWMQQRSVAPTIREMYAKGALTVEGELARAAKSLAAERGEAVPDAELAILEAFGSAIMKKLLHGPTARLRREAETADSYYYTGAARYLFGLDTYPAGCMPHACAEKPCLHGSPCAKGLIA